MVSGCSLDVDFSEEDPDGSGEEEENEVVNLAEVSSFTFPVVAVQIISWTDRPLAFGPNVVKNCA